MRVERVLCLMAVLAFAGAGCKAMSKVGRIVALQRALAKEFKDHAVGVTEVDKNLAVLFQAERFAEMTDDERAANAKRAAEFLRDHDPEFGKFEAVVVMYKGRPADADGSFQKPYVHLTASLGPPAAPGAAPTAPAAP